MWVNKDFFKIADELLGGLNAGNYDDPVCFPEKYNKKKYLGLISNLTKLQQKLSTLNSSANSILEEKYDENLFKLYEKETLTIKTQRISRKFNHFINDIKEAANDLSSLSLDSRLPIREDHTDVRLALNHALQTLSRKVNELESSLQERSIEVEELYTQLEFKNHYLKEFAEAIGQVANGQLSADIPWSQEEEHLFKSVNSLKQTLKKMVSAFIQFSDSNSAGSDFLPDESEEENDVTNSINAASKTFKGLKDDLGRLSEDQRVLETTLSGKDKTISEAVATITSMARGDYTTSIPASIGEPDLKNSLEELKSTFQELSKTMLDAAQGKYDFEEPTGSEDLIKTALAQMLHSFQQHSSGLRTTNEKQSDELAAMKTQQTELMDYNLAFEKRFKELMTSYQKSEETIQEQKHTIDRLQKRNTSLEGEIRSVKQKHTNQTGNLKAIKTDNDSLLTSNRANVLLIEEFIKKFGRNVEKQSSTLKNYLEKTQNKKGSEQNVLLTKLKKDTDLAREAIHELSRNLETSSAKLRVETVVISDVLEELWVELIGVASENGIALDIEMGKGCPTEIETDPLRFRFVLRTILLQAIRQSSSEAINCRVSLAETNPEDKKQKHQIRVLFQISFTGKGLIDGEQIVLEAFKGFYSIRPGHQDEVCFGLNLVRDLTSQLNGELHLTSYQNQVDTYHLVLPVNTEVSLVDSVEPDLNNSEDFDQNYILILSENQDLAAELGVKLQSLNYLTRYAPTVENTVKVITKKAPDIVMIERSTISGRISDAVETIQKTRFGYQLPLVLIGEKKELEADQKQYFLKAITYSSSPTDLQSILKEAANYRIFRCRPVLHIFQDGLDNSLSEIATQLKQPVVSIPEGEISDYKLKDYSVGVFTVVPERVTEAVNVIQNLQKDKPDFPMLAVVMQDSYMTQTKLEPLVDAVIDLESQTGNELIESIRYLQINHLKSPQERSTGLNQFLNTRVSILKNKQILMIADSAAETLALRKQLNLQGIDIKVNTQGKNLESVLENNPNCSLIIIKKSSNKKAVLKTVKTVKSISEHHNIPVILIDNDLQVGEKEFWLSCGVNEYLVEPVDLELLLSFCRVFFELGHQTLN